MKGPSYLRWMRPLASAAALALILNVSATAAAALGADVASLAAIDKATDSWDSLLARYVRPHGGVDYAGFAAELPKLREFVDAYAKSDFKGASDDVKKAAYINLYNAGMIYNVLRYAAAHSTSVSDTKFLQLKINELKSGDGNLWNGDSGLVVGGEAVTLDDIEHHLLRRFETPPQLALLQVSQLDPRIHAAVNCAAYSCPRLRPVAYRPATVDQTLQAAAQEFLSDDEQFHKTSEQQLRANSIVYWYYADFDGAGKKAGKGGAGGFLADFIRPTAATAEWKRGLFKAHFNDRSRLALKFSSAFDFSYNWLINDMRNKP